MNKPEKILITGATGLIGGAAARRWAALGLGRLGEVQVSALVRDPHAAATQSLSASGVHLIEGDLTDPAALQRALQGCDLVVHAAAGTHLAHPMKIWAVDVEATRTLYEIAASAGVRRFIFISSISVYPTGMAVDEETPIHPSGELYSDAKLAAELALREASDGQGCPLLVILRLAPVYGPGAARWTEQPLALARSRSLSLPGAGQFPFPYLYIENMVDALTAAASAEVPNQSVYNIYDGITSYADFMGHYARMTGSRLGVVPAALVKGWARVVEAVGWVIGRYPVNNARAVQFLLSGVDCPPAAERAARDLSWHPRISLEEGMAAIEQRNGFHRQKKEQNPWQENEEWQGK